MIARLLESPFYYDAFRTSHHDKKLPITETVFYIVWMGKLGM